jgi:hypothetical protein
MKTQTIIANCQAQTKRNECATAIGILLFFFEDGGLHIVFRDGRSITEPTPATLTGNEHLFQIIERHAK